MHRLAVCHLRILLDILVIVTLNLMFTAIHWSLELVLRHVSRSYGIWCTFMRRFMFLLCNGCYPGWYIEFIMACWRSLIVLFRFYRPIEPFMENMLKKKPIPSHDSIFCMLLLNRFESDERVYQV